MIAQWFSNEVYRYVEVCVCVCGENLFRRILMQTPHEPHLISLRVFDFVEFGEVQILKSGKIFCLFENCKVKIYLNLLPMDPLRLSCFSDLAFLPASKCFVIFLARSHIETFHFFDFHLMLKFRGCMLFSTAAIGPEIFPAGIGYSYMV